jgi:hypothetical protein
VDEVNAPPDNTIHKGDTWNFEIEPVSYEVGDVNAAVYTTGIQGVRYQARLEDGIGAVSDTSFLDGTQELMHPPAWIRIEPAVANEPGMFYLTVTDTAGQSVKNAHPDDAATQIGWTLPNIPLADLSGINAARIESLSLGVEGPAGTGSVYVDYSHVAVPQMQAGAMVP